MSRFYGSIQSGSTARGRQRHAQAGSSSVQYGPGMRLSDHPGLPLTDSDTEEDLFNHSNLESPDRSYFSTPHFPPPAHSSRSNSRTPTDRITPTRPGSSASHQNGDEMVVLFQKQQALLQEVITTQCAMAKKQDDIESKLHVLQDEAKKSESPEGLKGKTGDCKRKRVVTLTLSVSIRMFHYYYYYYIFYCFRERSMVFMKLWTLIYSISQKNSKCLKNCFT